MSIDADIGMFGELHKPSDFLRQRRRTIYRLASALEHSRRIAEELQLDLMNLSTPQATPQLHNDLGRVFLILTKLITWCWHGALASEPVHTILDASETNALRIPLTKSGSAGASR